jgi:hypothetical protein
MLVVDAPVAAAACHTPVGVARVREHELVAPQLMLIEASSVLHEMAWRKASPSEHRRTPRYSGGTWLLTWVPW